MHIQTMEPPLTARQLRTIGSRISRREYVPDGAGGRDRYRDGVVPGLWLVVGSRSMVFWQFFQVHGLRKRRSLRLGQYPDLSLVDARKAGKEARAAGARGEDPTQARSWHKQSPTIADLLEEYEEVEGPRIARADEEFRLLRKDISPALMRTRVDRVTRREIVLTIDEIRSRSPSVAEHWRMRMLRLLNFAAERGIIERSPTERLPGEPKVPRARTLDHTEIARLWGKLEALSANGIDPVIVLAIQFLLATGVRSGEACGARWDEIDGTLWTIPAARSKAGINHEVPLSTLSEELLRLASARRAAGERGDWVFPGRGRHILVRSVSRALWRNRARTGFALDPFHPHDLRRVVRTNLAQMGIEEHVSERVLGHKQKGIVGTYNTHAYRDEKAAALQAWADRLMSITQRGIG